MPAPRIVRKCQLTSPAHDHSVTRHILTKQNSTLMDRTCITDGKVLHGSSAESFIISIEHSYLIESCSHAMQTTHTLAILVYTAPQWFHSCSRIRVESRSPSRPSILPNHESRVVSCLLRELCVIFYRDARFVRLNCAR